MYLNPALLQRSNFDYVDPVVTAYITGLVQDEDEEVEEIVEMVKGMLWDAKVAEEALESFISRLASYLEASSSGRQKARPAVHRLEKAIDMKTSGMSTTIALSGQVDLEHGGKSQVRIPSGSSRTKLYTRAHLSIASLAIGRHPG
jgi:ATP-binding cassette subfamily F protein 3